MSESECNTHLIRFFSLISSSDGETFTQKIVDNPGNHFHITYSSKIMLGTYGVSDHLMVIPTRGK